jgi:hypothetical protein
MDGKVFNIKDPDKLEAPDWSAMCNEDGGPKQ